MQGLENGGIIMKNQKRHSRKLLSILLVLCMALTIVPITAFAAGVNYIDKISVTYTKPDYKAGDAPQAAATVTEGECSVAYEYWMEIEQKTEGSVWTSTGRYWYSDSSKMASLAADKRQIQACLIMGKPLLRGNFCCLS